jgi:hypothetical protein
MKLNFWKTEAPVVENESQKKFTELASLLEEYGRYSVGVTNAVDNESRNRLFKDLVAKSEGFSEEEIKKACGDAHMIISETNDFISMLREQKIRPL